MSNLTVLVHNLETDKIVKREMTAAEAKQYETNQKLDEEVKARAEAKATAKAELLAKLGITAEEAALLLG